MALGGLKKAMGMTGGGGLGGGLKAAVQGAKASAGGNTGGLKAAVKKMKGGKVGKGGKGMGAKMIRTLLG